MFGGVVRPVVAGGGCRGASGQDRGQGEEGGGVVDWDVRRVMAGGDEVDAWLVASLDKFRLALVDQLREGRLEVVVTQRYDLRPAGVERQGEEEVVVSYLSRFLFCFFVGRRVVGYMETHANIGSLSVRKLISSSPRTGPKSSGAGRVCIGSSLLTKFLRCPLNRKICFCSWLLRRPVDYRL